MVSTKNIQLLEEILHQLRTLGNYETVQKIGLQRDKPSTNWCRISSIHSSFYSNYDKYIYIYIHV